MAPIPAGEATACVEMELAGEAKLVEATEAANGAVADIESGTVRKRSMVCTGRRGEGW